MYQNLFYFENTISTIRLIIIAKIVRLNALNSSLNALNSVLVANGGTALESTAKEDVPVLILGSIAIASPL